MTAAGYTIGSENSGTIQDISLSSNSVTIEEGGNTAEVTATLNTSGGSTNYVLIEGLYYPLNKKANGDIELEETGKKTLEDSTISLSDVTADPTGSISATLDSSTGKVTITSTNVTANENNDKVELKYNNTTYGTINVAVKKASISIPATADVTSGGTTTLTATLAEYQKGTVSWSITPDSTYASLTGSTTGTSVTVTGGTTTGQKVTVRATYTTGTAPATAIADCEVTVKADNHIADKSYVDYNVSYTDVYTGTEYTSDTGWRLLTDLSNETAGTYTGNVEIISTGIPAKLYYHNDSIQSFENTNPKTVGKWAGDSSQRTTYRDSYYSYDDSTTNKNIYAAAGLMYNFENIVFNYSGSKDNLTTSNISKEYGGYVAISNGGTAVTAGSNTTGASLFRVSSLASGSVSGIRSVSLADLTGNNGSDTSFTDKRTGLFTLQNYTPDTHNSGYYWLASPNPSDGNGVRLVSCNGYINYDSNGARGLRPVVSISNVKLELHGNVWQIVANNS